MRSREASRRAIVAALCLAAAAVHAADDAASAPADAASSALRERIAAEVAALKRDPDLFPRHKVDQLRWKHPRKPEERKPPDANWFDRFARWLDDAGRALLWAAGVVAIAFGGVALRRWWRWRTEAAAATAPLAPSHVRDLDIRPESLPADIGAAARRMWEAGDTRAALSLLYRGALSRLVHDHRVPIRAASTEGECVQLVARALPREASAYFRRLVDAWQTEVYAGRSAEPMAVITLCNEFDAHFAPHFGPAPQAGMATA